MADLTAAPAAEVQPDFSAPPASQNPALPPPPTPDNSAAMVPSVQHTRGEKITEAMGSRAAAFAQGLSGLSGARPHDFADSSVGKMLQQHYDSRIAEARVNYNSAQQLLNILDRNVDPDTGGPLTPEKRAKYFQDANAAWGAYAKSAGVDKQSKAAVAQKGQLFQLALTHGIKAAHEIATKLGLGGGGQAQQGNGKQSSNGVPPPPSPQGSQPSTGATPPAAGAGTGPASAPTNAAVPPPPTPQDAAMEVPRLQAEMADRHKFAVDQAEEDIKSKAKQAEDRSKAEADAAGKTKNTPASDAYFSLLDQVDPKTGQKYTPQDALKIVSQASAKAGRMSPFEEYMADPENYKKFESEMAKAKQTPAKNASFGSVYAIYRMLETGYKQNPAILPLVAQLAPQVFASAGMKIPPGMAEALARVPIDQPLSPETGEPIGTAMPGAPTAGTRTQAQTAARIITGDPSNGISPMSEIRKEVKDLAGYLGPEQGRVNVKYLLGKAGSTGDPDKDQKLSKLRTDLTFLASASAKFHLNSVRAMDQFEALADAGKDSSAALGGFLDSVEKWAGAAQRQEQGAGETKGITPPPPPSASTANSSTKQNDPLGIR